MKQAKISDKNATELKSLELKPEALYKNVTEEKQIEIFDNENSDKNVTDVGPFVDEIQKETEMVSIDTEKGISENQDVSNVEQETNMQRDDTLKLSTSSNDKDNQHNNRTKI